MQQLLEDVLGGHRMTKEEGLSLLKVRDRRIWDIVSAADAMREQKAGNTVTYVRNQNVHITNICKNLCAFCGFGKPKGAEGTYLWDRETIQNSARLAKERKVTEICLLSGVHPDFTAQSYADIISWVNEIMPGADIHTASPDEIVHAAKQSGLSVREVLEMLREAGLGTLQGTAAEILVDDVRRVICPRKIDTETWVRVIKEAHAMGIKSTATIMYGSVESEADRIEHLSVIRDIQDETGGFTEFIPLSYLHQNTALYRAGLARAGATGREDMLLFAVSRLFLDNIDNLQISWGKVGRKCAQLGLLSGGNDLGGTMFTDEVSMDAGGDEADFFDPTEMERICNDIGRELRQRSTLYELL